MERPWLKDAEHDLLTLASVELATRYGRHMDLRGTRQGQEPARDR